MNLNLLNEELVRENMLSEIIYFDETDSTNNYSKKSNLGNNTLVLTSSQPGGTGRFGRPWYSSPGKNLTFSLIKFFNLQIDEIHLVNFYSSYILCMTLKEFIKKNKDCEVTLKWPNDILLNRKKLAGFLLDVKDLKNDSKKFIIGAGININQENFPDDIKSKATSLLLEIKTEIRKEELLIAFIKNFYGKLYLIENKNELMRQWNNNSKIEGKKINFKKSDDDKERAATVIGIDNDGGLNVKFDDGKKSRFYSGEISIVYDLN